MFAFFWVAGGLVTLAGLALVAMGAVPHDGAFDSGVLTAGTIAAVGGLLLIGIGVTVRELRRIERVMASRPSPPPPISTKITPPTLSRRIIRRACHLPAKIGAQPATPAATFAAARRGRGRRVRASANKNSGPRREATRSRTSRKSMRALWRGCRFVPRTLENVAIPPPRGYGANGATPPRSITDIETRPRLAGSPATPKAKVFNAFWSGGQRREAPTAAAQAAAAVARALPAGGPAPASQTYSDAVAVPSDQPSAVTILKSGVIEGMAYTLYSDGSIEAQLPQGTLRFGSIAALRDHIESKS